jgi:hypothetical protein
MSSFAESFARGFSSDVDLQWDVSSSLRATASFSLGTDAIHVDVMFEQRVVGGPWFVQFELRPGASAKDALLHAFRIFNGVFQAVRDFASLREPEGLVFPSRNQDLAAIYRTYLAKEKQAFEDLGYEILKPLSAPPYLEYELRRARPNERA